MNEETLNPTALDWGAITPEFVNQERGVAVHVLSHILESSADKRRSITFLNGRIRWFSLHLPEGWQQHVMIDDRGQYLTSTDRSFIAQGVLGAADVQFMSARNS